MNSPLPVEQSEPMNAASAQLIVQSQTLMMQMLDLQKWQQQVALRFIDAHQQLLQTCASGVALPALTVEQLQPLSMPQPVVQAPQPAPAPVPAVAQVAVAPVVQATPAPIARAASVPATVRTPVTVNRASNGTASRVAVAAPAERKVAAASNRNGHGTNGEHTAHENGHQANGNGAPVAKPAPAPAAIEIGGSNDPSVEQFKVALLKAVSERTGYPEDMLDLALPLESGLGIDSIKTVEIFSNLKEYHHVFTRDGDEEDALKEFTQLKNLGDIIGAYELHRQAAASGGAESNGNGHVERYTLETVEAGALNGEKKNSHSKT